MKKMTYMLLIAFSIGLFSCSSSVELDADGEKVLQALRTFYDKKNHDFSEIKLFRDVTAEDSLNFLLKDEKYLEKIIADKENRLKTVQNLIEYRNQYYTEEQINDAIVEFNRYSDGSNGEFDEIEWSKEFPHKWFYRSLYRYKNMPKNKVLAKIYSVTFKMKDGEEWKTAHWVLKPDLSAFVTGIKGNDLNPLPKSNFDVERLKFAPIIDENDFIKSYDEE